MHAQPLRDADQFPKPGGMTPVAAPAAAPSPQIQPLGGPAPAAKPPTEASRIRAFEQKLGGGRHEDKWARSPNITGSGAIHVRSFHCKLTDESLAFVDQQINEWLDAHPQYEVKLVTTSIGEWMGKVREPNIIIQVWV